MKKKRPEIFRFEIALFAILLCGFMQPAACFAGPLSGNPLSDLHRLKEGVSMRASSTDPNLETGNADWRPLGPFSEVTLADLEGPGIITHIWITISNPVPEHSKLMAIRIYWDGEEKPSVEAPIGDFFAVGHGVDAPVDSLPVQVSSEGRARNCFWPMPFKKSARIVVSNETSKTVAGVIYWYVDWRKVDAISDDAAYFHAQYRQEYPAKKGRYTILEVTGRGHYVGTVYSVQANMPGWIGEGDDFFYIDGETAPSIRGTGTEDYFADAWGFRQFNQPYHGVSLWEGYETGSRTTAYRWHLADPISFEKSLKMEIEHVGPVYDENNNLAAGYGERPDHYSTVAFWYQQGGGPNWTTMPVGERRLYPHKYIEAEARYQGKSDLPETISVVRDPFSSGGAYALFKPTKKERSFEVGFKVPKTTKYQVRLDLIKGPNMGQYRATFDGNPIPVVGRLYTDKEYGRYSHDIGVVTLEKGPHRIKLDLLAESEAGGSDLGVDGLFIRPLWFEQEE